MKRPRPFTIAFVILGVLLGALGIGLWRVSRPPSLGWTAEEIAAEQRALMEASMPPGEAAWPLIEDALERMDVIASGWPAGMPNGVSSVLDPLLRLEWDDPRLAPGKAAFAELAPVVDLLIEASARPRLFEDGASAERAGAFMDAEMGAFTLPAVRLRDGARVVLVDARRALHAGDERGFVERVTAAARLADLADQAPLILTISVTNQLRSVTLDAVTDAIRERELSPELCDALLAVAVVSRDGALAPDSLRFRTERLFSYAEALRVVERSRAQGPVQRILDRVRVRAGDTDGLDLFTEYDAVWLDWLASRPEGAVRAAFDAYAQSMTEWWAMPAHLRPADPPSGASFPDVGFFDSGRIIARLRGQRDFIGARAVGVAALLEIEAFHARTGAWPAALDEVPAAAALRDPVTGAALRYDREPINGWPFTLHLAIDDPTLERLSQPFFYDADAADERLVTRPALTLPAEELLMYPWLLPESSNE